MVNLYPNVSVALDMNVKLSGSFNNAKSWFKKDFYPKLSNFFQKTHFGWVFYSFVSGFFAGLMGRVFCANPEKKCVWMGTMWKKDDENGQLSCGIYTI